MANANTPDEDEQGSFVTGGFRQQPPVLPPIAEVERNTVYQDETGTLWKAINGGSRDGRWIRAEVVTAAEGLAARRKYWLYAALAAATVVLAWVVMISGVLDPLTAPYGFLVPGALVALIAIAGFMLYRQSRIVVSHIVAPESSE